MSGSVAERDDSTGDLDFGEMSFPGTGTDGAAPQPSQSALQQIAVERLAAHRNRKAEVQAQEDAFKARAQNRVQLRRAESRQGASRVRDAVAARYESSVSYREFLAAEAEAALIKAQAEAEIAAQNAIAVAEAQTKLLAQLDQWNRADPSPRAQSSQHETGKTRSELAHALADIALGAQELMADSGFQVHLADQPRITMLAEAHPLRVEAPSASPEELANLEEEIEFRLSPQFPDHRVATEPIPANIIEFPRQLVASRKARPRLAEGPLRDEFEPLPQMRIFEVEPEQISLKPIAAEPTAAPEWQSLQLGATALTEPSPMEVALELSRAPQTAPLQLRLMAALVDGCCVAVSFVAFTTIAVMTTGAGLRALPLPMLGGVAAGVLCTIFLLYQMLFFSLSYATPGMRYARVGLCTFADSNPSRKAMRRRVYAKLLAACPLGLGLAWAMLDADRLGWHDRMTRMYPRAY